MWPLGKVTSSDVETSLECAAKRKKTNYLDQCNRDINMLAKGHEKVYSEFLNFEQIYFIVNAISL